MNQISTIAADALAPCITRPSVALVLTMWNKWIHIFPWGRISVSQNDVKCKYLFVVEKFSSTRISHNLVSILPGGTTYSPVVSWVHYDDGGPTWVHYDLSCQALACVRLTSVRTLRNNCLYACTQLNQKISGLPSPPRQRSYCNITKLGCIMDF